jgi:hypothetical protein
LVSHAIQDPTSEPEARNTHTYHIIFTFYVENMNGFRKWFVAFRKVSSGEKIINKFLMNHQVFDESSSFC